MKRSMPGNSEDDEKCRLFEPAIMIAYKLCVRRSAFDSPEFGMSKMLFMRRLLNRSYCCIPINKDTPAIVSTACEISDWANSCCDTRH